MNVTTRPLCLTPRREAVLIALYRLARPRPWGLGRGPTVRELQEASGYRSTWMITWHLMKLRQSGLAYRIQGDTATTARAWRPNYERLLYITQDGVTAVSELAAQ